MKNKSNAKVNTKGHRRARENGNSYRIRAVQSRISLDHERKERKA
jgi:hypothetical protein